MKKNTECKFNKISQFSVYFHLELYVTPSNYYCTDHFTCQTSSAALKIGFGYLIIKSCFLTFREFNFCHLV